MKANFAEPICFLSSDKIITFYETKDLSFSSETMVVLDEMYNLIYLVRFSKLK